MRVYVLGVAMAPAARAQHHLRLEELVYTTSRRALDSAGVTQRQLDHVTLASCDELDGRPISSMLLAAPAGGYDTDEIKVTDSGAMALCLGYARLLTGEVHIGLVASWCKSSKTDVDAVMQFRGDPFFTRPLGIGAIASDGLFAQAVSEEFQIGEAEANRRAADAYARAARNPRGMHYQTMTIAEIAGSPYEAPPIRTAHRAPPTDGAVSMVLGSEQFVQDNADCRPLARLTGVGWASDSYRLGRARLRAMGSARTAWRSALRQAGFGGADLDVIEIEAPTAYHEAAYARAFDIAGETAISPSGGTFAQNPLFCSGLVNAAEAVLQVSGTAGEIQRERVRRAAAHSCHGYAQQGNIVMVFETVGATG